MYIIQNKYDYEGYETLGLCKTIESGKAIIQKEIDKLRKEYENSKDYVITTQESENEINVYREKISDIKDGFYDKIWYDTYYIEKIDYLD